MPDHWVMTRMFGQIGLILLLSGCFMTDHPLIDASSADTPFADGTRLAQFSNCDAGPLGPLVSCKGYKQVATLTLHLTNGTYRVESTMDKMLAPGLIGSPGTSDAAGDALHQSALIKQVGPDLFIVQMPSVEDDQHWMYDALRRDGKSAYLYILQCEQNGDLRYVRSGDLSAINNGVAGAVCTPVSLPGLSKIITDRVADGIAPDQRLDVIAP